MNENRCSHGYTLIEVVLTLILIVAVMAVVMVAIKTHLNQLTSGKMQTEEARLARVILDQIARDIHAVVLLQETTNSSATDPTQEDVATETDQTTETATEAATNSNEETLLPETGFFGTKPGIYGGIDWIQIDTIRPLFGERLQNPTNNIDSNTDPQKPGVVRTVIYYLGEDTGSFDADEEMTRQKNSSVAAPEIVNQGLDASTRKFGLYIRELDRLKTEYAQTEALELNPLEENPDQPMALEVDDLEFRYYDGTDWCDEWNMDQEGSFPVAVRVILTIRRKEDPLEKEKSSTSSNNTNRRVIVYSLTIPTSMELIQTEETEE